jgi:hypothetical protein
LNIECGCFGTVGGQQVGVVNLTMVDDSFAPGIGRRVDGWSNRDLNARAIINLAPNVSPFTVARQVDEATVRTVLNSWGLAQNLRRPTVSGRLKVPI